MLVPLIAIGGLLLLVGASGSKPRRSNGTPSEQQQAALFCTQQGGYVELMEDVNGVQRAMCIFPDGGMVDAVDYMRGTAEPEIPTCVEGQAFDPVTGRCVPADTGNGSPPPSGNGGQPSGGSGGQPMPMPGPDPAQVCGSELATLWEPYTPQGENIGANWFQWLTDAFFALATGTQARSTGGQSIIDIFEEAWSVGDPAFARYQNEDFSNVQILTDLGILFMTGGQTCQPWMIPAPPPFQGKGFEVWASIFSAAQLALEEAANAGSPTPSPSLPTPSLPAPTLPSAPLPSLPSGPSSWGGTATPTPSGGTATPTPSGSSGGGSICPPNWAYNALYDKCCPDGYSYDPQADTCKPTQYMGATRSNLPIDLNRRGVPRRDWGPMGASRFPVASRGSGRKKPQPTPDEIFMACDTLCSYLNRWGVPWLECQHRCTEFPKQRTSAQVKQKLLARRAKLQAKQKGFAGMGCSTGGCGAKWVPNRGQRMGNAKGGRGGAQRPAY